MVVEFDEGAFVRAAGRRAQEINVWVRLESGQDLGWLMGVADGVLGAVTEAFEKVSFHDFVLVSPDGPVWWLNMVPRKVGVGAVMRWLAGYLDAAGVSGRLVTDDGEWQGHPLFEPWRGSPILTGVAAGLSIDHEQSRGPDGRWVVTTQSGVMEALLEFALDWCRLDDGRWWVTDSMFHSPIDEACLGEVTGLIRARDSAPLMVVCADAEQIRVARMTPAKVVFDVKPRIPGWDWPGLLGEMTAILRTWAPAAVFGFATQEREFEPRWDSLLTSPWRNKNLAAPQGLVLEEERAAIVSGLPALLLGPEHRRVPLPDRWRVDDLDAGRWLVTTRETDAWALDRVTPVFLYDRRDDFEELVTYHWNDPLMVSDEQEIRGGSATRGMRTP